MLQCIFQFESIVRMIYMARRFFDAGKVEREEGDNRVLYADWFKIIYAYMYAKGSSPKSMTKPINKWIMSKREWSPSWQNAMHFLYQRHLNNHFYANNILHIQHEWKSDAPWLSQKKLERSIDTILLLFLFFHMWICVAMCKYMGT